MLCENLKALRKAKGLSQEELAVRLNVVRQTVSKWETGLSVPDSEMLIRIAEALDTTVSNLLGEPIRPETPSEYKALAAKLEILNGQFARQNEQRRKHTRLFFILLIVLAGILFLSAIIPMLYHSLVFGQMQSNSTVIGGYDGPTNIWITDLSSFAKPLIVSVVIAAVAAAGLYGTRRKQR